MCVCVSVCVCVRECLCARAYACMWMRVLHINPSSEKRNKNLLDLSIPSPDVRSECHLPHAVGMEVKLVVDDVREVLKGKGRTHHSSGTAQHGLHSHPLTLPFTFISHSPLHFHLSLSPSLSPLIPSFHSHPLTDTPHSHTLTPCQSGGTSSKHTPLSPDEGRPLPWRSQTSCTACR